MKINFQFTPHYQMYSGLINKQNTNPCFTAKHEEDEFVCENKKSKSFSEKLIDKISPRIALERDINKLMDLRNKKCPDYKIDADFINSEIKNRNLKNNELNVLKQIVYLPDNRRQLDKTEILNLADFSSGKIYGFSKSDSKFKAENIIKYRLLSDIKGRRKQLSLAAIEELGNERQEVIEKVLSFGLLKDIKGRKPQLEMYEIISLAQELAADNEEAEKVLQNIEKRKLLSFKFGSGKYLDANKVVTLAKVDDDSFADLLKIGFLKEHQKFEADFFDRLLFKNLDDESLKRFKMLFEKLDPDEYKIDANTGYKIINMTDETFTNFIKMVGSELYQPELEIFCHLATLGVDILDKLEQANNDAMAKKDLLKNGEQELTNYDIDYFFEENGTYICDTIYTIGLPAFEYAYASKLDGLKNLVNLNSDDNFETFQFELKNLLNHKNIPPEERLDKFRIIANLKPSQRETIYPYIKPHIVTPEHLKDAKEIWAQRGKTFDEKYSEFCEKFHISEDDYKIRKSIEKLAAVNSKGYKLLYNIGPESMKEVIKKKEINEFNEALYKMIFDMVDVEYDEVTAKKLNLSNSTYMGMILSGSSEFIEGFNELVEVVKDEPDKTLKEIFDDLPQNRITRSEFKKLGIDYDKWCDVDKNSFVKVKIKTNVEKARKAAITNLEKDLCDKDFSTLPKSETGKIFKALKNSGYYFKPVKELQYDNDGFIKSEKEVMHLFKNDNRIEFKDLSEIINIIKNTMNAGEFWFNNDGSANVRRAKDTIRNHIMKLRYNEIKEASALKSETETDIEVHKTDMNNIAHSLFLGNQSGCCTAVGSAYGNDYAAPRYILDKCIQAIEVMDGKEFVGNTMCYIAEVNGKPSLILDNIELTTKYQYNDSIRDAIFEYAKILCEDIGKPDMPIFAGPFRHKVNMDLYNVRTRYLNIVGDTNGNVTYVDYCGDKVIDGVSADSVRLYKIR